MGLADDLLPPDDRSWTVASSCSIAGNDFGREGFGIAEPSTTSLSTAGFVHASSTKSTSDPASSGCGLEQLKTSSRPVLLYGAGAYAYVLKRFWKRAAFR